MKKRFIYFVMLTILPMIMSAQVYYNNTFSFGTIDHPVAFVSDQYGNVIVCGWFEDADHPTPRGFILKVNINGDEVWRTTMEEPSNYTALCITESGSIALAGSKNNHCYLTMVNSASGEEIWSFQEDTSEGFWFGSVNEISNGFVNRLHAAKTTDTIHLIQYKVFDSESGILLDSVVNINHSHSPVFVSGKVSPDQIWFAQEGLVAGTDFDGYIFLWEFGAIHISGIEPYSPNEGCVVRYWRFPGTNDYFIGILIMTLDDYTVYGESFDITYPEYSIGGSGILGTEKILVTGTIGGELAVWFIDHALTQMYERTYPSDPPRVGVDVLGLPSNDMVVMGTETDPNGSETDIFLMKLDAEGLVSTADQTLGEDIQIYPNLTSGTIKILANETRDVEVTIYNHLGQLVKKISDINANISVEELPDGLYVAVISVDGVPVKQEKIIKR